MTHVIIIHFENILLKISSRLSDRHKADLEKIKSNWSLLFHFKSQLESFLFLTCFFKSLAGEEMSLYLEFNTQVLMDLTKVTYLYFSTINGLLVTVSKSMMDFCFSLQFIVFSKVVLYYTHEGLLQKQSDSL